MGRVVVGRRSPAPFPEDSRGERGRSVTFLRPQWLQWARKGPSLRRSGRQGGTSPPGQPGAWGQRCHRGSGTQTCLPAPQLSGFRELVGGSAAPPCALPTSRTLTSAGQMIRACVRTNTLVFSSPGPRGPEALPASLTPSPSLRGWVLEHWVRLQLDTPTGGGSRP